MTRRLYPVCLLVLAGCVIHRWSATPDGKVLAIAREKTIFVTDPDLNVLERYPAVGKPAIVEISPDGKKIAYNTTEVDGIWIIDRETKKQRRIAEGKTLYLWSGWSPGSDRLVFSREVEKEGEPTRRTLEVHDLASGKTTTLPEPSALVFAWLPDGKSFIGARVGNQAGDKEPRFGSLVLRSPDGSVKDLCDVYGYAHVEALDAETILFVTMEVRLPRRSDERLDVEVSPAGLYRYSIARNELDRLSGDNIVWFTLSPDRRHILAIRRKDKVFSGALYDITGRLLRVFWEGRKEEDPPSTPVPFWVGPDAFVMPRDGRNSLRLDKYALWDAKPRDLTAAYEKLE